MIEQFGSPMIKRFAAESGLEYLVDEDDGVCMGFLRPGSFCDGGALAVWISCCEDQILQVHGVLALSDGERADLLEWCNTWNRERPWPTLRVGEARDDSGKHVVAASTSYPVGFETTYETIEGLCKIGMAATHAAWTSFGNWVVDTRFRAITSNIEGLPSTIDSPQPGTRVTAPWPEGNDLAVDEEADRQRRLS